ncbi:hypothetical protein PF005_g22077 [Phytophthora fragariae]|uniref:Uncharacterized protein n=1 Tax=Phytophthora fragariae TaxID=53985 RepID=A0A6A3IRY2_9STRA|nr:hypothetical protein PF009_g13479 [Phytophthora fragariae]KAE8984647.1 hypothetical protein PF011_g20698 [Phytophthora fragariae]KAE9082848.1 hypothetical protein PF007_g22144 [Phytophthora fragariae]KAE9083126.1 hypothetical protein PF010_g21323 [Phytophthora fragariae]KAE9107116.1 hypothetical protein PF006_g21194 [Phytophthora fragariae]
MTSFAFILSGMNTTATVDVMAQHAGIHKSFLSEIDNLLLGGQGPRQCLITLRTKYIDNEDTFSKGTFFKDNVYRVEDDAFGVSHKPLEYQNKLLVLDCFSDTLEKGQISVGLSSRRSADSARSIA